MKKQNIQDVIGYKKLLSFALVFVVVLVVLFFAFLFVCEFSTLCGGKFTLSRFFRRPSAFFVVASFGCFIYLIYGSLKSCNNALNSMTLGADEVGFVACTLAQSKTASTFDVQYLVNLETGETFDVRLAHGEVMFKTQAQCHYDKKTRKVLFFKTADEKILIPRTGYVLPVPA